MKDNSIKDKKFTIEARGFAKGTISRYIEIYAQSSEEAVKKWENDPSEGEVVGSDFEIESVDYEKIENIDEG